jgi:hypothetical protein
MILLNSSIVTYFIVSGMLLNGFLLYKFLILSYYWLRKLPLPDDPKNILLASYLTENGRLAAENTKLKSDLDRLQEIIIRKTLEK